MICGAPFVESSDQEIREYLKPAVAALSKPLSASLEEKRIACLYHLHEAQKRSGTQ
jgi:hypothetical protein